MKRRNFLAVTATGTLSLAIPTFYNCSGNIEYDPSLAEPQSLSHIWDTETIQSIGEQYRRQFPGEATEQSLAKLLLKEVAPGNAPIQEKMEHKITRDYESGKIVTVSGWLLAATEARQCALFSILQPK